MKNKEETEEKIEEGMALIAISLAFGIGCALGYFLSFILIKILF